MEVTVQGMLVIAALAVAFERILELGRWVMEQPLASSIRPILDGVTAGRGSVIPAIALAYVTNANLFYAFQVQPPAAGEPAAPAQLAFFSHYLQGYPAGREVAGCVVMGLALTLGSRFWHDLVMGLTDVRNRVKPATSLAQAPLLEPPVVQPMRPLVVAAT
jgi:hypothetical protein